MIPVWLIPGIMNRNKVIKEGKLLEEQLKIAKDTAAKASTIVKKPNLLASGLIVGTGGLIASKEIADAIPDEEVRKPRLIKSPSTYSISKPADAEFIIGIAATIENTLATTWHGLRNARLKKQIAEADAITDNAKLSLEQARKSLPIKLGAIGLGTAAIATPTIQYLQQRKVKKNGNI